MASASGRAAVPGQASEELLHLWADMSSLITAGRRLAPSSLRAVPALFVRGHCQVPCGIFDDPNRVVQLKEDAATVRKAMVQINELSGAGTALSLNQATRWILTKEDHAKSIITTVSEYMLCQRVKKVKRTPLPSPPHPRGPPGTRSPTRATSASFYEPGRAPYRSFSRMRPTTCRRWPRTTRS